MERWMTTAYRNRGDLLLLLGRQRVIAELELVRLGANSRSVTERREERERERGERRREERVRGCSQQRVRGVRYRRDVVRVVDGRPAGGLLLPLRG